MCKFYVINIANFHIAKRHVYSPLESIFKSLFLRHICPTSALTKAAIFKEFSVGMHINASNNFVNVVKGHPVYILEA